MSVQAWLREEDAKSYNQRPDMVATRRLLADFLEGKVSTSDAAVSVLEIYRKTFPTFWGPRPLEQFWIQFSSVSCCFGGDPVLAGRMVDLLFAISLVPAPVHPADGKPLWADADRGWLRGFGYAFREYGTYVDEDQEIRSFEEWIKQAEPLANAYAFAATLLLREDSNLVPMAESSTWILCCALESEFDDDFGMREADMFMPAAAAFVRIAGKRIYELCVSEEQTSASGRAAGPLWRGERKLSIQRWQFWKERFAHFSTMDEVGEDCRRSAAEASLSMARAEEQ